MEKGRWYRCIYHLVYHGQCGGDLHCRRGSLMCGPSTSSGIPLSLSLPSPRRSVTCTIVGVTLLSKGDIHPSLYVNFSSGYFLFHVSVISLLFGVGGRRGLLLLLGDNHHFSVTSIVWSHLSLWARYHCLGRTGTEWQNFVEKERIILRSPSQ